MKIRAQSVKSVELFQNLSAKIRLICVYLRPKKSVESVKICVIRVTIPHFILHRAIGTITTPHSYA